MVRKPLRDKRTVFFIFHIFSDICYVVTMTGTKFFAGQFCLFLGTALCFTSQGTLDLAELHSLQYSVEILDTPVEDITEDTEDKVQKC